MSDAPAATPTPFRICFVCTGNICRSPMAEAVMRSLIREHELDGLLEVSSAATGDWHVGERADPRAGAALERRGFDGSRHRARQFESSWFPRLDLVLAFDHGQERVLRQWAPTETDRAKVQLIGGFDPESEGSPDVPDPFYSDSAMFESVLQTIERASRALFQQLEPAIRRGNA